MVLKLVQGRLRDRRHGVTTNSLFLGSVFSLDRLRSFGGLALVPVASLLTVHALVKNGYDGCIVCFFRSDCSHHVDVR